MNKNFIILSLIFLSISISISCTHKPDLPSTGGYPVAISNIILTKCAVSGCHNNESSINAAGINLSTWTNLFNGGTLGATVIPYRPDFSNICYFTNTDSTSGIMLQPTMPIERAPLTKDEYNTLTSWIASGAPNIDGIIRFTDSPSRKKLYVTNRMCNVVTVLDEKSFLQIRYINVGDGSTARYPYCVKVSPDKKNWYVSFFTQTTMIQKFDADNDNLVGNLNIGSGSWTSFTITSDSKYGYFVDNSYPGKIAYVDLTSMSLLATYTFGENFKYPLGIALNDNLKKIYVGSTSGNFIYNIDITDPLSPHIHEMSIDGSNAVEYGSSINPVELVAGTGNNYCFVACQGSNEIRVLDMQHDTIASTISLAATPAYISYSTYSNQLFVTCPDDLVSFPGEHGAVIAIDVPTLTINKKIDCGYQPFGISVDDDQKIVSVVNANISGPASHHTSGCGKKIGYLTFIDYNTLEIIPGKIRDVAVFPFSIATR